MKKLRKFLAIILSIAMVMCSTLPSVASEIEVIDETTKSKIEEQLREDLGEERANEILNGSEEITASEEETTIGANADDVGAKLGEPEEEEEETTEADEETTVEANADDVKANTDDGAHPEDEENQIEAQSDEEVEEPTATPSELSEIDEEETGTEETTMAEPVELKISIASKSTTNKTLYGADEAWMYWWVTNEADGKTIHYQSTDPGGVGANGVTRTNNIVYDELDKSNITKAVFENQIVAKTCSWLFMDFTDLNTIENIEYLTTGNVARMDYMFKSCTSLTHLDLSSLDTSKVYSMVSMFIGCSALKSINLSNFNTSYVDDMSAMFQGCSSLTFLDLSSFNASNLDYCDFMFKGCTLLHTIAVSENFNLPSFSVKSAGKMFENCISLRGGKGTVYEDQNVDFDRARIDGGPGARGYFSDAPWMIFYQSDDETMHYTSPKVISGNYGMVTDTNEVFYHYHGVTKSDVRSDITKVVFDDEIDAETFNGFFNNFTSLSIIDGLAKLKITKVNNMQNMFNNCSSLTRLDLRSFDTTNVTKMQNMFAGCSSLKTIVVSDDFVTTNLTDDGSDMFKGCTSLVGVAGTTYDDSNPKDKTYARIDGVTSTPGYFTDAADAPWMYWWVTDEADGKTIHYQSSDPGGVGAEPITGTGAIFYVRLDSNVRENITKAVFEDEIEAETCEALFFRFIRLETIEKIENLKTSKVTNMGSMFMNCMSLKNLDLSSFNTSKVTNMSEMFGSCQLLEKIIVSDSFVTTAVENSDDMFEDCYNLTGTYFTRYIDVRVETYEYARIDKPGSPGYFSYVWMWWYLDGTNEIHFSGTEPSGKSANAVSIHRVKRMTYDGLSKENIEVAVFDNEINAISCYNFFDGFTNLNTIKKINNFKTNSVTKMAEMFRNCKALEKLDLSSFDTTRVNDMSQMFNLCESLIELNLSSFITENVKNMQRMFRKCSSLKTIIASDKFITTNLEDSGKELIFENCNSIVGGKGTVYDSNYIREEYARIDGGPTSAIPGYFTDVATLPWMYWRLEDNETGKTIIFSSTDEGKTGTTGIAGNDAIDYGSLDKNVVTKAEFEDEIEAVTCWELFSGFTKLELIEGISNLNTENVTNMAHMFLDCSTLIDLNLVGINTLNVTDMAGMFMDCISLTNLNLLSFDTQNTTDMIVMFCGCINLETIVVSDSFITKNVEYSEHMFTYCEKLVGCYGTAYDENKTNKEYASIDNIDKYGHHPGYFSSAPWMYWYLSDENGDSTFETIHFSKTKPTSGGVAATRRDSMLYSGLSKEQREKITKATFENRIGAVTCDTFFKYFKNLSSIENLVYLDTTNVIDMKEMFAGCENLENLHWENLYASKVESMHGMFVDCKKLKSLELSSWNTVNLDRTDLMFSGCSSLSLLDISTFDTAKVWLMCDMFENCSSLKELDLSSFNTAMVEDITQMFNGCSSLERIYVSNEFVTTAVTNDTEMFEGCTSLKGGAGTAYDGGHTDKEYARIDGGPTSATPGYFTLYVPPTPPAPTPTYSQNYSSDRDGGGGGGGIAGPLVDVIIPAVTYLPIVKNILAVVNNTTSKWTKDTITNKHKLNIINQNGTETPATLGFYNYTNVVTHIVNNLPVQTQTNDTYVFDDKGNMITGWVRTADGKWYLFEYEKTTNEGKMVIGWKKVQGAWYYFGTDGAMLTNAYTPDGHYVGPDGKWVSP